MNSTASSVKAKKTGVWEYVNGRLVKDDAFNHG